MYKKIRYLYLATDVLTNIILIFAFMISARNNRQKRLIIDIGFLTKKYEELTLN